jgi:16S rRNA (uracil1498-N3)-methyltransferase
MSFPRFDLSHPFGQPVTQIVVDDLRLPSVRVDSEDARHLVKVLRLRVGDSFVATDGRGGVARLVATALERDHLVADVLEHAEVKAPSPRLWLVADAEGARADWLVEKAVELGAHAFVPVDGAESRRRERFARLARAALKQSLGAHGLLLPEEPALDLARQRAGARQGFAAWIAHPGGAPLAAQNVPAHGDVFLVSGSAGGLNAPALAAWEALPGAVRVDLGPRRLRAETAALMLLVFARASALCSGAGRETA